MTVSGALPTQTGLDGIIIIFFLLLTSTIRSPLLAKHVTSPAIATPFVLNSMQLAHH